VNLDVETATSRQRESSIIKTQSTYVAVKIDSRNSKQNVSERLKPPKLSQRELWAEQKEVLTQIGAGNDEDRGTAVMAAEIGFDPEPFDEVLVDRRVPPVQVTVIIQIIVKAKV